MHYFDSLNLTGSREGLKFFRAGGRRCDSLIQNHFGRRKYTRRYRPIPTQIGPIRPPNCRRKTALTAGGRQVAFMEARQSPGEIITKLIYWRTRPDSN